MSLSRIRLTKLSKPAWLQVVDVMLEAPFWLTGAIVGSTLGALWHGVAYGFTNTYETWNQTRKDREVES